MDIPDTIDGIKIVKYTTAFERGLVRGWKSRQDEVDKLNKEIKELTGQFERTRE